MIDVGSYRLAEPLMIAWLLAPLLVGLVLQRHMDGAGAQKQVLKHPAAVSLANLWQQIGRTHKPSRPKSPWPMLLCWWLGWLCLTMAAMQPEKVQHTQQVETSGLDIVMAVDLSRSMLAMDFAGGRLSANTRGPNRLDVVSDVAGEFIIDRVKAGTGDRYGLVLFGDDAFVQSPLSVDGAAVLGMLEEATVGLAGDATAIGDAVALGVKLLRERPRDSRVLILLTDGAHNAGTIPPRDAARLVKDYSIRFYAIGVGREGMVPFPEQTPHGERVVMARLELDEATLKQMAYETGGKYFHASNTKALKQIYAAINKLERSEAESRTYIRTEPLFRWPLGAGLLLMLSCVVMRVRGVS